MHWLWVDYYVYMFTNLEVMNKLLKEMPLLYLIKNKNISLKLRDLWNNLEVLLNK